MMFSYTGLLDGQTAPILAWIDANKTSIHFKIGNTEKTLTQMSTSYDLTKRWIRLEIFDDRGFDFTIKGVHPPMTNKYTVELPPGAIGVGIENAINAIGPELLFITWDNPQVNVWAKHAPNI